LKGRSQNPVASSQEKKQCVGLRAEGVAIVVIEKPYFMPKQSRDRFTRLTVHDDKGSI